MKTIELLAPARDYEHGCAAVECGADALYVGAPGFGARADAAVSVEEIEKLCVYAHRFGVKVFVTMNTLVFEEELSEAERIAGEVYRAGADALIVQDLAFLRMNLPPIEIHASTQMFTMNPQRAKFWGEVGFSRIILERASTMEEIRAVAEAVPEVEIEAFVHGAICVAYSGKCYMSRSMSPRSGNRGACLQSCRLPFDLVDGQQKVLLRRKHLLSVQDLNLTEHLETMIEAGVTSFKIEGRLKDIHYVRNVVGWYRERLDALMAGRDDLCRASRGKTSMEFTPDPVKSFARGATDYYITGITQGVSSFDTPKSLGEAIGSVTRVTPYYIEGENFDRLVSGDGVCFVAGDGKLVGTHVNRVEGRRLYPNRMEGMRAGTMLFRNYDHRFITALGRSRIHRQLSVTASVEVTAECLRLILKEDRTTITCQRDGYFEEARNPQQALESIRTQVAKTGDTIYTVSQVEVHWDVPRFIPRSLLNELRREGIAQLDRVVATAYVPRLRRSENRQACFPQEVLAGNENIVNSLSERFYREHGVKQIERGYDQASSFEGVEVMRMRYCLRREMGMCLRKSASSREKLFIETGQHRYELLFDCARCEMGVIYRGSIEKSVR